MGPERVSVLCTDDYHRYNRKQRKELGITPLNPECNYLDIMAQHLQLLRAGEPILKPHYDHKRGDFGPPQYIVPKPFLIVEGLLGMYWQEMRSAYSVRVFLKPPEELRRRWKIRRDTLQRGCSEAGLHELDIREPDSSSFIRPRRYSADVVVSFYPGVSPAEQGDDAHLNVHLTLYGTLPHPDLSEVIAETSQARTLDLGREGGRAVESLEMDGAIPDGLLLHISGAFFIVWMRMEQLHWRIRSLLRSSVRRRHPLPLTQLLLVYHLLRAKQREGDRSLVNNPDY